MLPQSLKGIRVLDLTRIVAGPFCTMLLADQGATVFKIEKPVTGDESRLWGPPFLGKDALYYMSFNRNKKSLGIDMKSREGQDLIRKLAIECDVLVENFLPGQLAAFGLDWSSLHSINSRLVYCSVTGFGQHGPWAQRPGLDLIVAGLGGTLHATGPPDRTLRFRVPRKQLLEQQNGVPLRVRAEEYLAEKQTPSGCSSSGANRNASEEVDFEIEVPGEPCRSPLPLIDMVTGCSAATEILAALLERERSPAAFPGRYIDCSLLNTSVAIASFLATSYLNANVVPQRYGTAHANIVPYQAFRTSDAGHYIIGCVTDAHFAHLCQLLSASGEHSPPDWRALAADPRFASNSERVRPRNRAALLAHITRAFGRHPLDYWTRFFASAPFPCGPVLHVGQTFVLEQVRFAGMALELELSQRHRQRESGSSGIVSDSSANASVSRPLRIPAPAVRYTPPPPSSSAPPGCCDGKEEQRHTLESNAWPHPVSPPPQLGEHTDEVLREQLGLEHSQLERLHQQGVLYKRSH